MDVFRRLTSGPSSLLRIVTIAVICAAFAQTVPAHGNCLMAREDQRLEFIPDAQTVVALNEGEYPPVSAAERPLTLPRFLIIGELEPRSLVAGNDGKLWFSNEELLPHSIGFLAPDGNTTRFAVPCDQCNGAGDRLTYIESLTVGTDGHVYFPFTYDNGDGSPLNGGLNSYIGSFAPDGQFVSFPLPTVDAFRRFAFGQAGHSAITAGPDGRLWFTENVAGKVGNITTSGVITEYPLGSQFAAPSGIATGPDGALWFAETGAGKIGRITVGGLITEFSVPKGPVFNAGPLSVAAGADGNIWFTDLSGAIDSITPGGTVTRYRLETNATPINMISGSDRHVWFSYTIPLGTAGDRQGKITRFDPVSLSSSPMTAVVNSVDLTPKAIAGEFAQSTSCPVNGATCIYVSVLSPDTTGTSFVPQLFLVASPPSIAPRRHTVKH